jgi:hypothetical protein
MDCLGGVVVSVLATERKGCEFESGQSNGILRAIKICSTPASRMGSKAVRSHVVRFYGMLKISWSPTGMSRLNSYFLCPYPTSPVLSGDDQSALVVKLGVRPSRSHLLTRLHSLSSGDSTTGPRPQCWDDSVTPSQQPMYSMKSHGDPLYAVFSKILSFHSSWVQVFSQSSSVEVLSLCERSGFTPTQSNRKNTYFYILIVTFLYIRWSTLYLAFLEFILLLISS